MRPARLRPRRSTCVIAPRMIPSPAQMLRGRPLTHCTPRRATGNRVLRCAADRYDRTARAPHRQIPRRTHDGDRLRTAARLLAMTSGGSQGLAHVGALAENLVALVDAVAGLRQAHAAQAAAARKAGRAVAGRFHPGTRTDTASRPSRSQASRAA